MNMITKRLHANTPPFFKKLRNAGLAIAGAAGVILTAPVSMPAIIVSIAGYAAVAGTVLTTVSQLVTADKDIKKRKRRK